MTDSTLAFNILARDGASGAFEKVARSADKTSAAMTKIAKISDNVAKAEARLSKARDGESDAMGRVRVAEQRLQELRDKGLQGTSRFTAAEESLSTARRKAAQASNTAKLAEDSLSKARTQLSANAESAGRDSGAHFAKGFGDEGEKSGKRFGSGMRKWFKGDGSKLFGEGGQISGEAFSGGLGGVLKTPIVGPAVLAGVAVAAATVLPAAGALAGTAVVSGFGAGIAGLGLVFAAKSEAVQRTWKSTLSSMGADTRLLSKPFEKTLVSMAAVATRTFDRFAPELGAAFERIAPALSVFGDMLGRAFEKLAPAIRPLSLAFENVLRSLGPAMQTALTAVSQGLIDLAKSVQRNPDALSDLVRGVGDFAKTALAGLGVLNDFNGAIKDMTGVSAVTALMGPLKLAVVAVVGPIATLNAGLEAVGLKTKKAGIDTGQFQKSLFDTVNTIRAGIPVTAGGSKAVETLAQKFDRQWQATQRANEALTRMSGLLLTLSGSQIAYQQAVDDATASIEENGRTHDINTQKGRNNKLSLDQVAASAQAQTVAMRSAGDGNVAAAKAAEGSRATYIKLARQMGFSATEAQKMARDMIKIPNVTREARLKAHKLDLDQKLAAAKKQLADPKLSATKKATLKAEIAQLLAAKATAQRAIDSLRGRIVPISVVTTYTSKGIPTNTPLPAHQRRASGGPVKKGLPYLVGEEGPEPFIPDQDGMILPNSSFKTRGSTALGGAGGGGGVQRIELVIKSGGSRMDDLIVQIIQRAIKVNGGDIRLAKQLGLG